MLNNLDNSTRASDVPSLVRSPQSPARVLTAKELVELIRQGDVRDRNGYQVLDNVSLKGETIALPLKMQGVVFQGEVNLSECRFERGVDLAGCRFERKLILTDTRIEGSLKLDRVTIGTEAVPPHENGARHSKPPAVAELTNLRLAGCLSMMNAHVFGRLSCTHAEIEDEFRIDQAQIHGDLMLRRTSMGEFCTDGRERLANADTTVERRESEPCRIDGDLNLNSAKIAGDVRLLDVIIGGELALQTTEINGNLLCRARPNERLHVQLKKGAWLLGVQVKGTVDISGAEIDGNLMMQNASVGQNLLAKLIGGYQTEIRGTVFLNGASVSGGIEFLGSLLQEEIDLDGASIGGDLVLAFDLDDVNDWRIVRSRIGGRIHAESAKIGKRVILMGLTVGSAGPENATPAEERKDVATAEQRHGVDFVGAQVNGELLLYSQSLAEEHLQAKKNGFLPSTISPEREQELLTETRRERAEIQGYLRLTRAQLLGGVVLDGSLVTGELDLRNATVRANINCMPLDLGTHDAVRASVRRAELETLNAIGDINLTGLTIHEDLSLRDTQIRGRLELFPAGNQRQADSQRTRIGGKLRLDAADIAHVVLSGNNFEEGTNPERARSLRGRLRNKIEAWKKTIKEVFRGDCSEEESQPVRVVLERATIGRLEIVQPLPGRLDLSNLKVGSWEERENPNSNFFENMLENSFPFRKSNYLAIENELRNKGRDEEADRVHVLMRRRDRRHTRNLGKKLADALIFDLPTRYGTMSRRLFWCMVVFFAFSVWLFSNTDYIEYKTILLANGEPPAGPQHPLPGVWSIDDAFFLAGRLHVPIISLGIDEEVQPSGVAAKAYAILVVAFSWVAWPLFIASLSGFLRRRG